MVTNRSIIAWMLVSLIILVGCSGCSPAAPDRAVSADTPYSLVSQESLFAYLEELTAIQAYSGWRNSASMGETQALEFVGEKLRQFDHLQEIGLELENQRFRVFLSTELWDTALDLTVAGEEIKVPADGLRGPRDDIRQALRFDSDGVLNDSERNPVVVKGPVVLVRSAEEIDALDSARLAGAIVFLDYAAVDRALLGKQEAAVVAGKLLAKGPAGLVLVTQLSNQPGESHGSFVGDLSALNLVETAPAVPTLYARLEDLAPAGISGWDDLERVEDARITWDADIFSPGESGNLIARIPGQDTSRAVILGAHIDSPNSPGAMDDGSGSVILLEVARILNLAQGRPPVDIYLVWFGSEELGLYGSFHFAATHQELLDRTLAMLQTDMLSRPLDGISAYLNLVTWSYGRLGDARLAWPEFLQGVVRGQGVRVEPVDYAGIESDNSALTGFDVPNANLIYMNAPAMEEVGGIHYACRIHDPYDTMEAAREMGDVLEQMAWVALAAAVETGRDGTPPLRVAPSPDRRALFIASHTESVHMAPTTFIDLGMALSWEGFDVDMIPYGRTLTAADLDPGAADLVVVLPVVDYPSPEGDPTLYDEAWTQEEVDALAAYVSGGGLLVVANSAHRLKYVNMVLDTNEDWIDVNLLAERFGVSYQQGILPSAGATIVGEHPLVQGVSGLALAEGNGVPFALAESVSGVILAESEGVPAVALLDYGDAGGQVLVLADVGILGSQGGEPHNLTFWRNLAEYARSRQPLPDG